MQRSHRTAATLVTTNVRVRGKILWLGVTLHLPSATTTVWGAIKAALFCTCIKCKLSEVHDTNYNSFVVEEPERIWGDLKKPFEKLLKHNRFRNINFLVFVGLQLWFRSSKSVYACNQPHQNRCSIMKNSNSIFSGRAVGSDILPWITGSRALSKAYR